MSLFLYISRNTLDQYFGELEKDIKWEGVGHVRGFRPVHYVFVHLKLPPILSVTILISQKFHIMKITMTFEIFVTEDDSNLSLF